MTIIEGSNASANEVMNAFGSMFKDEAQLLYNTSFGGETTLKNVFFQNTLSADTVFGFQLSGGNYVTPEIGSLYYAIVEATSYGGSSANIIPISSGKWLIFDDDSAHSQELQMAVVHKII